MTAGAAVGIQIAHGQGEGSGDVINWELETDEERAPMPRRDPFALHPADPGAWEYEEQSPEMQGAIDSAALWSENESGYEVQEAWSRARVWSVAHSEAVIAERAAGLEGSEGEGVE